jgi:DNA-binding NtrC family response regulator
MSLPRVLMVVGDRYVLRLLSRLLGDSHDVSRAQDGREALACLESQRFEVVLIQLRGPGDLEILRAAKATWPDTEVVVLTGDDARDAGAEAAYALGAYECLTPFDCEGIMRAVERAVERGALRAEVERLKRELEHAPATQAS